ncbi:MAG: serine--tRNA ligase [Gemmatimonadota bacterium]
MLDIKALRANPSAAQAGLALRGDEEAVATLDLCLSLEERRRTVIGEVEVLKARRNKASHEVGERKRRGQAAEDLVGAMKAVADEIKVLDRELGSIEDQLRDSLLGLPNLPDARVPAGEQGEGPVLREWGEQASFDFEPVSHWDLGARLGILDLERAARIAGSGFPLLLGAGARLSRALIQFMLDLHTDEHGYVEVAPPLLVNRDALTATGQLPKFEEDVYRTEPDDLFLVPTAEVPVTNLHREEILDESELPKAYVAFTPCFRREAGAAGRDTRGLLRVHQFDKVELVRFCSPEVAEEQLEMLTRHAEVVLERLGLTYRRVLLPAGDLGFANSITYDLEVWAPGVDKWLEVSSCSSYGDFQARRGGIRYRPAAGGKPAFVTTLNGSGVALARTLVALLEHGQEEDGSVRIPKVLQPHMGTDRLTVP